MEGREVGRDGGKMEGEDQSLFFVGLPVNYAQSTTLVRKNCKLNMI